MEGEEEEKENSSDDENDQYVHCYTKLLNRDDRLKSQDE